MPSCAKLLALVIPTILAVTSIFSLVGGEKEERLSEAFAELEQRSADERDGFAIINGRSENFAERCLARSWDIVSQKLTRGTLTIDWRGAANTGGPFCPGYRKKPSRPAAADVQEGEQGEQREQSEFAGADEQGEFTADEQSYFRRRRHSDYDVATTPTTATSPAADYIDGSTSSPNTTTAAAKDENDLKAGLLRIKGGRVKYCKDHIDCFPDGKVCCPYKHGRRFICRAPRLAITTTTKGVLVSPPSDA